MASNVSTNNSSMLEVFQLNKYSKEDDLDQCIAWLREIFHDTLPKTISIVVKRSHNPHDSLNNSTRLNKSSLKAFSGLNSTSMMNNNSLQNGNNSFSRQEQQQQQQLLLQSQQKEDQVKQASQKQSNNNPSDVLNTDRSEVPEQEDNNPKKEDVNAYISNQKLSPEMRRQSNNPGSSSLSVSKESQQSQKRDLPNASNALPHLPNNSSHMSDGSSFTSNSSRMHDENDALGLSEKARQLYLGQKFKEALELYQKSQALAGNDAEITSKKLMFQNKIYIGSIYAQMKERQNAIKELREALEMSSQFDVREVIQENEQSSKEGQQKYINSNPLYFINLTLGNLYHEEKDYDNAIPHLEQAFKEIQSSTSVIERKSQALVLNTVGMIYYQKNQIPISIEKFKASLAIFQDLMQDPDCKNDSVLKYSYANRLNNVRGRVQNEDIFDEYVQSYFFVLLCGYQLGEAYRRNRQIEESIEKFQESLKLKEEVQQENNDSSMDTEKSIASTHNNLGMSFFSLKRFDDALVHLNIAVDKYETITSRQQKAKSSNGQTQDLLGFANILNQRGDCLRAKHELQQACDDFKKSYKLKQMVLGEENRSTLVTLNNYAQMLFVIKNFAKSKNAFFDLLKFQKKLFGEKDIQVAQTLNNIGTVLSENQEYDQAEETIKEAISIYSGSQANEQNLEKVQRNLHAIQSRKQSRLQQLQQQQQKQSDSEKQADE